MSDERDWEREEALDRLMDENSAAERRSNDLTAAIVASVTPEASTDWHCANCMKLRPVNAWGVCRGCAEELSQRPQR